MKISVTVLSALLSLLTIAPALATGCKEVTKYVQGGACAPHKGTKKHPFATLRQAEDDQTNWDVLIVLSSPVILNGGINLLDGKKLIGEEDPTDIALSSTQPTITNTDINSNGGNGVSTHGDVTIKNIYFRDILASAINYDDATNLTVKNVRITRYGQDKQIGYAGISGSSAQSGKTHIENVIIQDAQSNEGIRCNTLQNAQRELRICSSEFGQLDDSALNTRSFNMSTLHVSVSQCSMHELHQDAVKFQAFSNSLQTVNVEHSTFYNNVNINAILAQSFHSAHLDITVCSCLIEENNPDSKFALSIETFEDAILNLLVKKTTSINKENFIATGHDAGTNSQTIKVLDNTVIGDKLYSVSNLGSSGSHSATIKNTNFNGVNGISILALSPWGSFNLCAEHNCFTGTGTAILVQAVSGVAPGATINAHDNNIVFFGDILDTNGGVTYNVQKNWWGPGSGTCPCPQYQTCIYNTCFGPKNVLLAGTPLSTVDANNPLVAPIRCPHSCCGELPPNPQHLELSQEELAKRREEIMQRATQMVRERLPHATA